MKTNIPVDSSNAPGSRCTWFTTRWSQPLFFYRKLKRFATRLKKGHETRAKVVEWDEDERNSTISHRQKNNLRPRRQSTSIFQIPVKIFFTIHTIDDPSYSTDTLGLNVWISPLWTKISPVCISKAPKNKHMPRVFDLTKNRFQNKKMKRFHKKNHFRLKRNGTFFLLLRRFFKLPDLEFPLHGCNLTNFFWNRTLNKKRTKPPTSKKEQKQQGRIIQRKESVPSRIRVNLLKKRCMLSSISKVFKKINFEERSNVKVFLNSNYKSRIFK